MGSVLFPDDLECWATSFSPVLLASQMNSSLKCLFKSVYHFIIGWFMFLLLVFRDSTCILDTSPLFDICKCIVPLPFVLFVVSSDEQKLSTLGMSDLSVFLCLLLCVTFLRNILRSVLWFNIRCASVKCHERHFLCLVLALLSFLNSNYLCILPREIVWEPNMTLSSCLNLFSPYCSSDGTVAVDLSSVQVHRLFLRISPIWC